MDFNGGVLLIAGQLFIGTPPSRTLILLQISWIEANVYCVLLCCNKAVNTLLTKLIKGLLFLSKVKQSDLEIPLLPPYGRSLGATK